MNPRSLYLRRVRTFDEFRIDLPEGLLAVIGANGAGKSTLISAIDVALFGPDGRSLAPWYPRDSDSDDPLTIELVFDHGNEVYRVRRTFSPKGRGQSKVDFERQFDVAGFAPGEEYGWEPLTMESQTATQEALEELIGLSRATFRASSYLAQGQAGVFCDAQPRDRKQILSEVVGLAQWEEWLERARQAKRTSQLEIAEKRALLERAEAEVSQKEELEVEQTRAAEQEQQFRRMLDKTLAALTAAREAHTEAEKREERRQAVSRAYEAAQQAVDTLRNRLHHWDEEIAAMEARLSSRESLVARAAGLEALEAEQAALAEAARLWEQQQRVVTDLAAAENQAKSLEERALACEQAAKQVLDHVDEEHCDRCGQILGLDAAQRAAESYRAEAARHWKDSAETLVKAQELRETLAALPSNPPDTSRATPLADKIREAQDAKLQLSALAEVAVRLDAAVAERDQMRNDLPAREASAVASLAELDALGLEDPIGADRELMEVQRLERSEDDLRGKIYTAARQHARCTEQLDRLTRVAAEAETTLGRLGELLEALDVSMAMERACSVNGIPALILESVAIPQVEAEATRLLRVLGGPATSVELRTQRETKTGGVSDTLDIMLMTATGEAPYESFSGGEQARIAFALRIALTRLLAGRKGAATGLLIVDEIDGLDAEGIAALVGVLEELQATVPRIIVVSHMLELRDAFQQSLTLENVEGRSGISGAQP